MQYFQQFANTPLVWDKNYRKQKNCMALELQSQETDDSLFSRWFLFSLCSAASFATPKKYFENNAPEMLPISLVIYNFRDTPAPYSAPQRMDLEAP